MTTTDFNSPHAIGPRRPDLDETELRVYEEEVEYLETREWVVVMGKIPQRYNEILKETRGKK